MFKPQTTSETNEEKHKKQQKGREKDTQNEILTHPLLNYIYRFMGMVFRRNDEKESQLNGYDIELFFRGLSYIVDEKADTKRRLCLGVGNVLNLREAACTFCYECSFLYYFKRGIEYVVQRWLGWGAETRRATALNSHYMLIWMDFDTDDKGLITRIRQIEILFISHEQWWSIIQKAFPGKKPSDISKEALDKIPANADWSKSLRVKLEGCGNDEAYVVISLQLVECPVNVITSKKALREHAEWAYAFNVNYEVGQEMSECVEDVISSWRPTKQLPNMPKQIFNEGGWYPPSEWDAVHNRSYKEWRQIMKEIFQVNGKKTA
jgi:hypothetical protein